MPLVGKSKSKVFASVWDAIADTPEEAVNLHLRSQLMDQIAALVKENGWTQAEAAARCGVRQPRINNLLRGRVSRFSLDALVNVAAKLGIQIAFSMKAESPLDELKRYEDRIREHIDGICQKQRCNWCRNPHLPIGTKGLCSSCYRWEKSQRRLLAEVEGLPKRVPRDSNSSLRRELRVTNRAIELCKADGDAFEARLEKAYAADLNDAFHLLSKRVLGPQRGASLHKEGRPYSIGGIVIFMIFPKFSAFGCGT